MFECVKCQKIQALYEDGTEWLYKAPNCPKCNNELNHLSKYSKHILKTTYSCPKCTYKEESTDDFKKSEEERLIKEANNLYLLEPQYQ